MAIVYHECRLPHLRLRRPRSDVGTGYVKGGRSRWGFEPVFLRTFGAPRCAVTPAKLARRTQVEVAKTSKLRIDWASSPGWTRRYATLLKASICLSHLINGFELVKIWVTSLRSQFSRRLSAGCAKRHVGGPLCEVLEVWGGSHGGSTARVSAAAAPWIRTAHRRAKVAAADRI